MRANLKTFGASALISFLFILPFIILEVVNRRRFNEEFPFNLFFVMWLNLFAISLILLPVVRSWWKRNPDKAEPVPAQRNTLLTSPRSATIISVVLFLSPFILALLDSLGWVSLQSLINGPDPEQFYLPGWFINNGVFLLQVAAGVVAAGPVARTLRAGGSLFAHPINLIIVVFLVSAMAYGLGSLIIDHWPCFMGVPGCD